MSKFVTLRITDENGKVLEPERWNTTEISHYRRWKMRDSDKDLTAVFLREPEKDGRKKRKLIVDNTVEELDIQTGVNGKRERVLG
tara:strand:+ start:2268 stop:2522 length:255 start_codon:yes stop_codon:yes gene_type:complete